MDKVESENEDKEETRKLPFEMISLNFAIWIPHRQASLKIDDINLDIKVSKMKNKIIRTVGRKKWDIELVFCGVLMEGGRSLASYGVTPGETVHVIGASPYLCLTTEKKLTDAEVQQYVTAFKAFACRAYRPNLQRISRPDVLESMISEISSLASDPAALAFIQDPELLISLADSDTIRRVADSHPALIDAANYIVAHLLNEPYQSATANQASTSSGYSYSLEALSDDEDMDSDTATREDLPLTRNSSYNAITSAQLAAAIANATNTAFNTNSAGMPSPNRSLITSEMFSSAMQQAFATSPFRGSEPEEAMDSVRARLQPQLQQMHEMGLNDDVVNVRALQANNGDVQMAIELVFSGAFAD